MSGLFDSLNEKKRDRLRQFGWKQVQAWGSWRWERPEDKALLTEDEAFAQLEHLEAEERP